jgi:tRNA A-37 threonylcarbamoyl transferase component Bud32
MTVVVTGFVPPEPADLQPHFPQLEILALLGKGGMGAVYKARQKQLGRLVAVKILPSEVGRDPAFAERFSREARALAQLHHQNIVGVYDFGQTGDLYYFVMEFVDGANLRELIRSGNLTSEQALGIVPQVCEALQFAHDEGIVHRDIKPENILIDSRGRVKIADFGLAKLLGKHAEEVSLTRTHQVMGTMHYMAPEQMQGAGAVDHRADIYSLGVVLYELLTGELPIGRFDVPSKKATIDLRLDEVVLRTLESKPERRYQHVSELKTELETICGISPAARQRILGREFRSETTIGGIPLVHIAYGLDPATGRNRTAKGIIAIGDTAVGLVAIGSVAIGGVAMGGLGVGLVSFGGGSIAVLLAIGGVALGGFAFGGLALGVIAIGAAAAGFYSFGGMVWGLHAVGGNSNDPDALRFFLPWAANWWKWLGAGAVISPLMCGLIWLIVELVFRRQASLKNKSGP